MCERFPKGSHRLLRVSVDVEKTEVLLVRRAVLAALVVQLEQVEVHAPGP